MHQQNYAYDSLNRISWVGEYLNGGTHTGAQQYSYDRWGNRRIDPATWGTGINNKQFDVNTANNRLVVPGGQSGVMSYDSAGNLTTDTYSGNGSRTYDAENRMTSAQGINQGNWQYYTYNADGQRVRRKIEGVETWQVYGMDGELLAEYAVSAAATSPQKEYGYRNGQLLITAEAEAAITNVASAANGGTASASSTLSPYVSSHVIDGARRWNMSNNTIWLDSTYATWPDWIQVEFNGSKTIHEIDVITQQDDYQNPIEPTLTQTFTSNGITAFDVQYWNGSAWATVSGGSVTGNNKVWRQFTFSPITTSKIRVQVNAGYDNSYGRVVEVEAWGYASASTNVASAANGGTASASSTLSPYVSSHVIDGARRWNMSNNTIWLDNTYATWPDWIQVEFNGSKTIHEIDVITQQDDYQNPIEPTLTQTFTSNGITVFDVQYWNGSAWATVSGGSVTGNNKVWRQFTFSPITTSKIRVQVNAGYDNSYGRVVEVEAWGSTAGTSNINWLVADHLGTPRMLFDKTGSLPNVKRHDYLPFGEELFAGVGGRTATNGYSGDNVRQKFTSKERDNETGLDYFLARYNSSTQGRFTSPDEFWKDSQVGDPQSWNKYAYVRNNPLMYIDPAGEKATVTIQTDEKNKTGKIIVKATIGLWTSSKTGVSKEAMQKAVQEYKTNIEGAWSGTYEQNGIKYEVTTSVDIQVHDSEQSAMDSGAQNVLKVTAEGGHSGINSASLFGGPDTGEIALDAGRRSSEAAHEFTHMLGVDDRSSGIYLSNTEGAQRAMSATAYDYGWAYGGAINEHRFESRPHVNMGKQGSFGRGKERSHTSTRELGAPYKTGTGFDWWR